MVVGMTKRTKVVLVAGTAALALAGIGGGVAFASGSGTPTAAPTPTTATATAPARPAHPRRAAGVLRRLEHGELTVGTKQGDQVVDVQRGQVTSVSATSVTVRSGDGFTATYAVDGTSKIRVHQQASGISSVHDGDRVTVVAVRANGTATVRRLADPR
jgi:Cu/Ag efflux protein CusF